MRNYLRGYITNIQYTNVHVMVKNRPIGNHGCGSGYFSNASASIALASTNKKGENDR